MSWAIIDYHKNFPSLHFELSIELVQPFLKNCPIDLCFLLRSISAREVTNVLDARSRNLKVTSWCFLLWPFLSRQPPKIDFKQISSIRILWYSHWNIRTCCSRISKDEKTRLRNQNSNYMMKNRFRWPKNLFDVDDFSNYVNSN